MKKTKLFSFLLVLITAITVISGCGGKKADSAYERERQKIIQSFENQKTELIAESKEKAKKAEEALREVRQGNVDKARRILHDADIIKYKNTEGLNAKELAELCEAKVDSYSEEPTRALEMLEGAKQENLDKLDKKYNR